MTCIWRLCGAPPGCYIIVARSRSDSPHTKRALVNLRLASFARGAVGRGRADLVARHDDRSAAACRGRCRRPCRYAGSRAML
eukprot:6213615-Pleurochrysis_carterae.AAC.2